MSGIDTNVSGVVLPVDRAVAELVRRLDAQEKRIGALYLEREEQRRNAEVSSANTLIEILGVLRHIHAAIDNAEPASSQSSVVVKTGTSNQPFSIECKAYEGSDIHKPETEALQSFLRLRAELEERVMAGWKTTVEAKGK